MSVLLWRGMSRVALSLANHKSLAIGAFKVVLNFHWFAYFGHAYYGQYGMLDESWDKSGSQTLVARKSKELS